jgi:hypothetical protein
MKRSAGSPIRHVVLLKFTAESTPEQKNLVESKLKALPAQIPEIESYTVGQDLDLDPGRNSDLSIVADFKSNEDYLVYASHAQHVGVITEFIKPILAPGGRTAIQFSLDGSTERPAKHVKRVLRLNTSNQNKLKEFKRMFGNSGIELELTKVDLREIDATPNEVQLSYNLYSAPILTLCATGGVQ